MSSRPDRYELGCYDVDFGDDVWKADQVCRAAIRIEDPLSIESYADVGCGNGGVFEGIRTRLVRAGFPIRRAVGYDIIPEERFVARNDAVVFKRMQFWQDEESFDLVTLNDVIEHVLAPQELLKAAAVRARYVVLHIPLDDRLSVLLTNQYNYRLGPVGHISFFNPASALNLLTAAGLLPLWVDFTPGFMAPSGRQRLSQRLILPFRWFMWRLNPGLMAATIGGASLAVLCRGARERNA